MKDSIILPSIYERILINEARNCGIINHIDDFELDYNELDMFDDLLVLSEYKKKQEAMQMLLLYDKFIIPESDPTYNYDNLISTGYFDIHSVEEFIEYNPMEEENDAEYASSLKSAILPGLLKSLKSFIPYTTSDVSYKTIVSDMYDVVLGIISDFTPDVEEVISVNRKIKEKEYEKNYKRLKEIKAPEILCRDGFINGITSCISVAYHILCWQLKLSSENDAFIVDSEFDISKIGYELTDDKNSDMNVYNILRCEYSKLIGELPKINNMNDILKLKKERKSDIKNLRDEISNLQEIITKEGTEKAIERAAKDVSKAAASLKKRNELQKVGTWTSILSVPVAIAESVSVLPTHGILGMLLTGLGGAFAVTDKILQKNNWCEIIR